MDALLSRVIIVGGGRVGGLLATLVEELGGGLALLTTRSAERVARLHARFSRSVVLPWECSDEASEKIREILSEPPSLLIFAVRDDALQAATQSVLALREMWDDTAVVHCSGATSLKLLRGFVEGGAETAVLHPCYPIVDGVLIDDRARMAWVIESVSTHLSTALTNVIKRWGAQAVIASGINRSLYHASQVLGAGHVVALYALLEKLLITSGLTPEQARTVVISLISGVEGNLASSSERELETLLTGPFVRGDDAVIGNHLAALDAVDTDCRALYELLGNITRSLL